MGFNEVFKYLQLKCKLLFFGLAIYSKKPNTHINIKIYLTISFVDRLRRAHHSVVVYGSSEPVPQDDRLVSGEFVIFFVPRYQPNLTVGQFDCPVERARDIFPRDIRIYKHAYVPRFRVVLVNPEHEFRNETERRQFQTEQRRQHDRQLDGRVRYKQYVKIRFEIYSPFRVQQIHVRDDEHGRHAHHGGDHHSAQPSHVRFADTVVNELVFGRRNVVPGGFLVVHVVNGLQADFLHETAVERQRGTPSGGQQRAFPVNRRTSVAALHRVRPRYR